MIYVVPILSGIILVVFLVIRSQNKTKVAIETGMTQAQKDYLLQTKAVPAEGAKGGYLMEALVVELKNKGAKTFVRVMWHNTVIPNNFLGQLMMANVNVSTADAEAHHLQVGDYVQFWMNPEKQKWEIVF
jgi:hypothetical protein